MSSCLKHSAVVGCWNKADTTKESVVIHYTYGVNASGIEILKATRYTTSDGTPIILGTGDIVTPGECIVCKKEKINTTDWLPYCIDGVQWFVREIQIIDGTEITISSKEYKQGSDGVITTTAPTGTQIVDGICSTLAKGICQSVGLTNSIIDGTFANAGGGGGILFDWAQTPGPFATGSVTAVASGAQWPAAGAYGSSVAQTNALTIGTEYKLDYTVIGTTVPSVSFEGTYLTALNDGNGNYSIIVTPTLASSILSFETGFFTTPFVLTNVSLRAVVNSDVLLVGIDDCSTSKIVDPIVNALNTIDSNKVTRIRNHYVITGTTPLVIPSGYISLTITKTSIPSTGDALISGNNTIDFPLSLPGETYSIGVNEPKSDLSGATITGSGPLVEYKVIEIR